MKEVKIGKYIVPLWLIGILIVSGVGIGALAYHVWNTLTISLEVKEPLEILHYPSGLSLFPGETEYFNVTVQNHASVNYSVVLDFSLDNTTYQDNYVTFNDEIYTAIPGIQNLTMWLKVSSNAPPLNVSLTLNFMRGIFPSGLVGYWRLDEGSGMIAFDSSENNNHGILTNGPVWTDGKYGKALSFDGIDDYVSIPDSPSLRVQSFTLEAWIYMTLRPYQHNEHSALINKLHHLAGHSKGYKLQFNHPTSSNDHLVLSLGDSTAQRFLIDYNSVDDLTLNQWHHVVGTYDGTTANLYIDGKLKSSSNPGTYVIVHDDTPLIIGREYYYSGTKFNGLIDNVKIYNRALSDAEIKACYTGFLPYFSIINP